MKKSFYNNINGIFIAKIEICDILHKYRRSLIDDEMVTSCYELTTLNKKYKYQVIINKDVITIIYQNVTIIKHYSEWEEELKKY